MGLIEKQMEYKMQLRDWEYFRLMKLVYQYCEKMYANDEICSPKNEEARRSAGFDMKEHVMEGHAEENLPDADTIWWCWLQGLKEAPAVVKACYHSLEKLGRGIVVITEENMLDYVSFPDYILAAKRDGRISRTHFSDLIRLELLTTHGGTWIDSTVYCTDAKEILDVMEHAPLFCYSFAMWDSVSDCMMFDNWFLHCTKPSRILTETKNMLYAYWKQESEAKHYFLFHLIFSIACRRNPLECGRIPIFSNEPVHVMQLEMMKPYDVHRWKQICTMSGIHKLTYKYDAEKDISGTMLEYVLQSTDSQI